MFQYFSSFHDSFSSAIILPTAWQFLSYIGVTEEYLLGATLSGA
jgi:hypothetical protein